MEIANATALIKKAFAGKTFVQQWADLGCGSGTFTYALASCLTAGSKIYAVDKKMPAITSLNDVEIECIQADIENIVFSTKKFDGILMANAFHYIKDKSKLIEKLSTYLKTDAMFLIVEYDTKKANRWVPYPVSFNSLALFFKQHGFTLIEKIGERNSIFSPQKMYAAVIKI